MTDQTLIIPDSTITELRRLVDAYNRALLLASAARGTYEAAVDTALAAVGGHPGQGIDLCTGQVIDPPPTVRVG